MAIAHERISPIPGAEGWYFGAIGNEVEQGFIVVPLIREDGQEAIFKIPDFISEPEDIGRIARVVIAARERWEDREGVGG